MGRGGRRGKGEREGGKWGEEYTVKEAVKCGQE